MSKEYTAKRIRFIADNYWELRRFAEDGGPNIWNKITGEQGLTPHSWQTVMEWLADFDTAAKRYGKEYKLKGDIGFTSEECDLFTDYLNRRKK